MTDWLTTDDLTIVLGLVLAAVVLLGNLFQPQSLVHPILLGRQSDVDRVRKKGESSVYRNYSTGLVGRVRVPSLFDAFVLGCNLTGKLISHSYLVDLLERHRQHWTL